jgi:hypothetical protein
MGGFIMHKMLWLFGFLLIFAALVSAQEAALSVDQMDFCTAVEEREPVGVDTVFSADVERIFCFTKISGVEEATTVSHVWYHGDKEMARLELSVKADGWRTWSSKRIVPEWTGSWRVEVLSETGDLLLSKSFIVQE